MEANLASSGFLPSSQFIPSSDIATSIGDSHSMGRTNPKQTPQAPEPEPLIASPSTPSLPVNANEGFDENYDVTPDISRRQDVTTDTDPFSSRPARSPSGLTALGRTEALLYWEDHPSLPGFMTLENCHTVNDVFEGVEKRMERARIRKTFRVAHVVLINTKKVIGPLCRDDIDDAARVFTRLCRIVSALPDDATPELEVTFEYE